MPLHKAPKFPSMKFLSYSSNFTEMSIQSIAACQQLKLCKPNFCTLYNPLLLKTSLQIVQTSSQELHFSLFQRLLPLTCKLPTENNDGMYVSKLGRSESRGRDTKSVAKMFKAFCKSLKRAVLMSLLGLVTVF